MKKQPCVYLLASGFNGTLYTGVTSDLLKRVYQHKQHLAEGFTTKYEVEDLVWFEIHESMESAIGREKAIKKWRRAWKIRLIEEGKSSMAGFVPRPVAMTRLGLPPARE